MKKAIIILMLLLFSCPKELKTPLQTSNYTSVTNYLQLINFVEEAASLSNLISKNTLGETREGREIPYLSISNGTFGEDTSKIKVLIFAAQHGNEQAGKEGTLLLISEIVSGKLDFLFDKIDLILIPNMNPDATEKDQRRNANDYDLNRNHLILTENETSGLHNLFNKYLPEATLDVHEYYPYSKSWREFGYLKFFDIQFGTLTNPNVSNEIIDFQKQKFLPYIKSYLNKEGFTFNEYVLDGPPNIDRMRYSTVDINDGRQSFGILNSFSFIVEGRNAEKTIENLQHRALAQKTALKGFLEFIYLNCNQVKNCVTKARNKLTSLEPGDIVPIRMEHVPGNSSVKLNLKSTFTKKDSVVTIENFHSKVQPHLSVIRPKGYLIPKIDNNIVALIKNHGFNVTDYKTNTEDNIYQYEILYLGTRTEEGVELIYPELRKSYVSKLDSDKYLFVTTKQLASNLIVTAFEPGSMLGIVQYNEFNYLLNDKFYPILRVE